MEQIGLVEGGVCACWSVDNYADSLQGRMIYKDECAKCFATPMSEGGLDVCLKCLVGSCSKEHSAAHAKQKGHPLVLNIKKTPTKNEGLTKVNKIAIGKPGGIDADTDKYDTVIKVYCYNCNAYLDHESPKVKPIVDSILLAQSAYDAGQVSEWELEITPCEHTLMLDQTGSNMVASKSMAHCGECELSSNLWLCLTCGHLGCGRKNYDGSGGNNHGLDHFKATGHGVNVKLGTITPEGKASIHCYHCDEEVIDNDLPAHLAVLGIECASQVKTEKTIAEQTIEANLNLTLSKVIEDGKSLIPVFGPLNTGMQNLGNTCYMNSIVQVLFSQQDFIKKYAESADVHLNQCTKYTPDCFQCQMQKLAQGLLCGKYSEKLLADKIVTDEMTEEDKQKIMSTDYYYQEGIRPALFKSLVGKGHAEFQTGKQQDAREYYQYVLDMIMKEEKKAKAQNPGQIFEFEMEKRLQCTGCGKVKYSSYTDNQLQLIAPVDSKVEKGTEVQIDACLETFFADSALEGVNCPVCQKACDYTQRYRFLRYPKVLCVVLQRFVYDDWVPKKLEIELQMPTKEGDLLDLESRYTSKTKCELAAGEEGFPVGNDVEEEVEPDLDASLLNMVLQMGIPENPAKHALYNSGNNSADAAVTWYFENMANEAINQPLKIKNKAGGAAGGGADDVPQGLLDQMTVMGFPEKKCKKALKACDMDVGRATEWLFSHMDDPDDDEEEAAGGDGDSIMNAEDLNNQFTCDKPGLYQLQSFVTHLGASTQAGHYVCHIRKPVDISKQDNSWIYFNDAKVAETDGAPFGKGYMYFFTKP